MYCTEPLRGPSGRTWNIISNYLYEQGYLYQIKMNSIPTGYEPLDSEFLDPIHRFVHEASNGTIRWINWISHRDYDIQCYILAFKQEPPIELVTETKLRFG